MQDAVVVAATRTAVGKAPNGTLKTVRPDEMAAAVIGEVLRRAPGINPHDVDDVIMGCAMPEAEQGLNVARIASLRAGVPVDASAVTMNRFCASGLQAIASGAEHIMCGFADVVVAGGTESMSLVPMGGNKVCPNPTLVDEYPDVYRALGWSPRITPVITRSLARSRTHSRCAVTSAPSRRSRRDDSRKRSPRSLSRCQRRRQPHRSASPLVCVT
jgi:acetyl-CoA acetyltransferase